MDSVLGVPCAGAAPIVQPHSTHQQGFASLLSGWGVIDIVLYMRNLRILVTRTVASVVVFAMSVACATSPTDDDVMTEQSVTESTDPANTPAPKPTPKPDASTPATPDAGADANVAMPVDAGVTTVVDAAAPVPTSRSCDPSQKQVWDIAAAAATNTPCSSCSASECCWNLTVAGIIVKSACLPAL